LISLFINLLVVSILVIVLQGMGVVIGFDFILRQARSRVFRGVALRVEPVQVPTGCGQARRL